MNAKMIVLGLLAAAASVGCRSVRTEAADESFNIATFNIRVKTEYDTDERYWGVRLPHVIRIMRECNFDVMGVQECTPDQAQDLEIALKRDWMRVGAGRNGGTAGESNSIFFRRARFEFLSGETFALSDTPDVIGSMTWGNRHPRICTVVKLYDKRTGKVFHYFNTHLDHECGAMNVKGMNLILSKVKALLAKGEACFLSGDMNAHPDSEPIKLARTVMNDTFDVTETPHKGPDVTFNWFGWKGRAAHRIDFMFATPNVRVLEHETVIKRYDGVLPSDHEPVVAKVVLSCGASPSANDAPFAAEAWPKTPSAMSRCWFIRDGKDTAVNASALAADERRSPSTPFVYTALGKTVAVRDVGDEKAGCTVMVVDDPSRLCEKTFARVPLVGGGDVMRFFLGATAGDSTAVTPAHCRAREILFDESTNYVETVGLLGHPESVAAVARRAADGSWAVAAVTDGAARIYEVPSELFGGGEWTGEVFYDAADGKLVHETWTFPSAAWKKLVFPLANGGGFSARFKKVVK